MKLRIRGNSIRLRLDRRDLDTLLREKRVEESLRFGPAAEQVFSYAIEAVDTPCDGPCATYRSGRLVVAISRGHLEEWSSSDRVGFEYQQTFDQGVLRVLVEKDFACIDRPSGEEADDAWAFPNPSKTCQ